MSFTPEDYAYLCNVLLAYDLQQQPLYAAVEEDAQLWTENAFTDVNLDLVYNNTSLDIVSGPPSPRPTGIPSPLMPELFFPPLAALPSPVKIPSGELELGYCRYSPLYGIQPSARFSPSPIPDEAATVPQEAYSAVAPTPDDIQIHHTNITTVVPSPDVSPVPSRPLSSPSQSQAQSPPHQVELHNEPSTTTPFIQITAAPPTAQHIPPPTSHNPNNAPKDHCRWLSCGQLIHTDRRSVSSHLRTEHGLDLRKKAAPIACLWPGCPSGALNADSLARHVSSAIGHLSGLVHGCERCLQRGYVRQDGLDRHLKDCPGLEGNFLTGAVAVACGCGCGVGGEDKADLKACYYRQGVVQRVRD